MIFFIIKNYNNHLKHIQRGIAGKDYDIRQGSNGWRRELGLVCIDDLAFITEKTGNEGFTQKSRGVQKEVGRKI